MLDNCKAAAGDFNDLNSWWRGTNENGSITIDSSERYNGSSSCKIEVLKKSENDVRMFNTQQCNFTLKNSETYQVSFYMKGIVGNTVSLTLMDDKTNLVQ